MPAQGDALVYKLHSDRGDGGPHSFQRSGGVGVAPSSFGMEATTLGPGYGAHAIFASPRRAEFEFRSSFFRCTNHDWKTNDINGMQIPSGRVSMLQPMLSQNAATPSYFVPMSSRRPNNPYRLARKIVSAFTGMLLSHGRWPQMRSDDPATQDWAEALVKVCKLTSIMIRARNTGGSCGLVGVSWGWCNGKPFARVHEGAHIECLKWSEDDETVPEHVTELYKFQRAVLNEKKGKMELVDFWHRRDWTPLADVVFRDCQVTDDEPQWEQHIDHERTFVHNHGRVHFEWISNFPDDEVKSCDGQPDYAEVYEPLMSLDMSNSVVIQGNARNLDPTLVLNVDPEILAGGIVRKGSDNALAVGQNGDAKYLELSEGNVNAGLKLVNEQKQQILDTTDCILLDPDKLAAAGMSSVALKMIYAPMIAKCDIMRTPYGDAIERIVDGLTDYARMHMPDEQGQEVLVPIYVDGEEDEQQYDAEGNPVDPSPVDTPIEFFVNLPPRQVEEPVLDAQGQPTGEQRVTSVTRVPGKGQISVEWGEYFKPTSDDMQKNTGAISQAAGGKAVMSQRTAVELVANIYNRDPNAEWVDVSKENSAAKQHELAQTSGMFPGAGELPPGGPEVPSA